MNMGERMQIGIAPFSLGFIVALVVLLFAILGLVGVIPFTPPFVFALVGALAVARLC
jgi:hypothetical protein